MMDEGHNPQMMMLWKDTSDDVIFVCQLLTSDDMIIDAKGMIEKAICTCRKSTEY